MMERPGHRRERAVTRQTDHGSKFLSIAMDRWGTTMAGHGVLPFGQAHRRCLPRTVQRQFQDGRLNNHWFLSLKNALHKTEHWSVDYN